MAHRTATPGQGTCVAGGNHGNELFLFSGIGGHSARLSLDRLDVDHPRRRYVGLSTDHPDATRLGGRPHLHG